MRVFWLWLLVACAAPKPVAPGPTTVYAQLEASADLAGTPIGHVDEPTLVIVFASWCPHCKEELAVLQTLHDVRILAVNYRGHEEYDHRGSSAAVKAFAEAHPWLRVVPIDDALFAALGSPAKIPSIYIIDRGGTLTHSYAR
ncbi:MAG TPA: TlpA disulfide reductase family protein, partial [Kofleriaceae bacterium]